jgi:hypothetical protein
MAIKLYTVTRYGGEEASLQEVEKLERDLSAARSLSREPDAEDVLVVTNLRIHRNTPNLLNDPFPANEDDDSSSEDDDYS